MIAKQFNAIIEELNREIALLHEQNVDQRAVIKRMTHTVTLLDIREEDHCLYLSDDVCGNKHCQLSSRHFVMPTGRTCDKSCAGYKSYKEATNE